ncbi:ABC transporter permease [Clostridium estertheticum]|uniref:FtsX-like permease family protein n=1 Tax=Clostridium estertheticum TaxID=238834 RepID=UPI0013E96B80|nr:FtsX-like permease family protein [Clostridium estertheticum]MBZ9685597.1 ABC transporter permease [Clostridium estertheticum]
MNKPLSYYLYFKSNKKKTLGMVLSIAFSILLIGVIQMFSDNMSDTYYRNLTKLNYISTISSTKGRLPKETMESIKNNSTVDKLIIVNTYRYSIVNIIGASAGYTGYYMDEKDIPVLMDRMGMKLNDGTLLKNDEKKIIINSNIARATDRDIGGYMGNEVSNMDNFKGKYEIKGIIKGDNIISFIAKSKEKIASNNEQFEEYLLLPKEGKLEEMNSFLKGLPKDNIKLLTYQDILQERKSDDEGMNTIFNILIIIIILVLSVSLGNSSYIHYFQRRSEFGLLKAIGQGEDKIILRMIKEISISSALGLAVGLMLLLIFKGIGNTFYTYPKGLSLFQINVQLIPKIIAIPIFICIFSIIPVSRLLVKIEPISIIERVG